MKRDHSDLDRLLEGYFDGQLGADDKVRLESMLRDSAEARGVYWEAAHWHAALSTWGCQQRGKEWAFEPPPEPKVHRGPWAWIGYAAAAAAVLLVFALWRYETTGRLNSPEVVAQVAYERGAVWATASRPESASLKAGAYRLEHGLVRLDTAAGAAITIAAPAEFRLEAAGRIDLTRGRLASRMLRTGGRLSVSVRGMEVRDLGTAFGIDASEAGHTLLSVFDGQVAVSTAAGGSRRTFLVEGQSIVNTPAGAGIESTGYAPDRFKDIWPLTVGIEEASSLVDFLPPGPLQRPLRDYRANDKVTIFPERQNVAIGAPIPLDISPEAPNWPQFAASPYPLAGGSRVNTYLAFFQPDPANLGQTHHLSGVLVFRSKVLGIICSDQWLNATDAVLGSAGVDYSTPHQNRGLEEADKDNYRGARLPHDSVRIDPDQHTVHFDFYVSDEREQLRILAAAD